MILGVTRCYNFSTFTRRQPARPERPARKLPSQDTTGIDPPEVTLEAQLNPVKILPQTDGWSEKRSVTKHFSGCLEGCRREAGGSGGVEMQRRAAQGTFQRSHTSISGAEVRRRGRWAARQRLPCRPLIGGCALADTGVWHGTASHCAKPAHRLLRTSFRNHYVPLHCAAGGSDGRSTTST